MHHYDVALKLLLTQSGELVKSLTGTKINAWLPDELPELQNRRLDLLGELEAHRPLDAAPNERASRPSIPDCSKRCFQREIVGAVVCIEHTICR